jgi:hypothetical protein
MNVQSKPADDAAAIVATLGGRAKAAAVALRNATTDAKNKALADGARLIRAEKAAILAANAATSRPPRRPACRAPCRTACCSTTRAS